jgi:hypothetical protein
MREPREEGKKEMSEDMRKARELWKMVKKQGMDAMPREMFVNAIMEMDPNSNEKEIDMWFSRGDENKDGKL